MGTIPTPATVAAGANAVVSQYNSLKNSITFWAKTPRCYAYAANVQALTTSGTDYVIALDTEVYDIPNNYDGGGDAAQHDNATNNSRLVCRTTGIYEVAGQVQIASNATGIRVAQIRLNAAGAVGSGSLVTTNQQAPLTGASTSVTMSPVEISLTAGDYVEMFARQTSGGSLNTVAGLGVTYLRIKLTGAP